MTRLKAPLMPCQACGQLIKKIGTRRWCPSCYDIETSKLRNTKYRIKKQTIGDEHGANRERISPKV
jgi:hypothetical protein